MANIKSAIKRARQSVKRRERNVAVKTAIKKNRRTFFDLTKAESLDEAKKQYSAYCSVLDKSAKKGVISRNTATRRKGRAAEQLRKLEAAKSSGA